VRFSSGRSAFFDRASGFLVSGAPRPPLTRMFELRLPTLIVCKRPAWHDLIAIWGDRMKRFVEGQSADVRCFPNAWMTGSTRTLQAGRD
jgi:hypothetical protein